MTGAEETTPLVNKGSRFHCCNIALRVRIVTAVISLAEGYDIGVVNGAVVLFKEDLNMRNWQVGLSLGAFPLCVAIFAPLAGKLADTVGRKPTMMVSCTLLIIGGLVMAFAPSFPVLLLGRMIAGSGCGTGLTAVTAYMAEVAPSHERGFYASLEELFVNVGNVVGYLLNFALVGLPHDWRIMLGLGAVPAAMVLSVLLLPFSWSGLPESPRYLQRVGRLEEAHEVLLELVNGNEEEANAALAAWQEEAKAEAGMATWSEAFGAFFGSRRKMALAGIGCGMLNNFTGIQLMMVTTTTLLMGAGMDKREAMWTTVWLGVIKATVMLIVALFILDRWGRRPLLLTSLSVCSAAAVLGSTGAYFNLGDHWEVAGLCLFVTGYSIGVGPVPWVYMPEVLDSRFRSKGCALGISGSRCNGCTHIFLFPILYPIVGTLGLFLFLMTVNVLGFAYVCLFCPESRGMTLEELQELFSPKHADLHTAEKNA
eukprot:TRINITY_DN15391_c0_g1_i2.p1 TRINITY_DN15391_c0_g1~~TRINITY_DN15391_c0_g1_i2.p1  ORF type:complete len:482 (+),score=82.19 TRINITY_DN15391_c0_g1_i2:115-1560(+)